MKLSEFHLTTEKQFDSFCKRVIKDEYIDYMRHLSRLSKKEVSFSELGKYTINQFSIEDSYSIDFKFFALHGISVSVKDGLFGEALQRLPKKKNHSPLSLYGAD